MVFKTPKNSHCTEEDRDLRAQALKDVVEGGPNPIQGQPLTTRSRFCSCICGTIVIFLNDSSDYIEEDVYKKSL